MDTNMGGVIVAPASCRTLDLLVVSSVGEIPAGEREAGE